MDEPTAHDTPSPPGPWRRAVASRGAPFTLRCDGGDVVAYPGETVATALLAAGRLALRHTAGGEPRGLFCAMGSCFECRITVDGMPNRRACMTPAAPGQDVRTPRETP